MAYGKLKADTLVYDNSGSDVEVTLSSLGNKANLASPTFTGTPVVPGYAPLAGATFTGNVVMSANLTVQGTTTTISSTTIEVADKNLELGKVSTPTDTTADGGGITLKGATDKTFNWVDATDAWTSSEHVQLATGKNLTLVSGALGIGDTTPNYEIHVKGADAAPQLRLEGSDGTGSKRVDLFLDGGKAILGANQSAQSIAFQTDYTDRLTIANDGSVTAAGSVSDSKGNVRTIPVNSQTSAYTAVAADAGKVISITTGGVTLNASVFAAGDAVTIVNHSGSAQTITKGGGVNLYNTADATDANRTLAARGMATVLWVTAGTAYISGSGLT